MSRICYRPRKFSAESRWAIAQADRICSDYAAQGYDLTLRQLYYQFVARDLIANKDSEYKRLGSIVNDARLAGLLDWDYIVDRTRNLRDNSHWSAAPDIVRGAADQFAVDKWAEQDHRVEVWIEKDALVGVLEACCPDEDVPFFSCRGYTSQSEIWGAAQRLGGHIADGKTVTILHLGDHDPSGVDMTRDVRDRLLKFIATDAALAHVRSDAPDADDEQAYLRAAEIAAAHLFVERIALNRDQIERYNPPPNPAKLTDARARNYIAEHGSSSWELDALEPNVLVELIRENVAQYRDPDRWARAVDRESDERALLAGVARRWADVKTLLNGDA